MNNIEAVVEGSRRLLPENRKVLSRKLEGLASSYRPGNWAARELDQWGLDGDYKPEDHGTQN